jgi:hypothetical protein
MKRISRLSKPPQAYDSYLNQDKHIDLLDIISIGATIVRESVLCQMLTYATKNLVCTNE